MKQWFPIRKAGALLVAAVLLPSLLPAQGPLEPEPQERGVRPKVSLAQNRVSEEKTGSFPVREGMRLKLTTDLGSIRVQTKVTQQLSYVVRVETLATEPDAPKLLKQFLFNTRVVPEGVLMTAQVPPGEYRSRLWVSFDLVVPQNFNLDLQTQAGNVEIQTVDGRVNLFTAGGNVVAGRIGLGARIETLGGHISVKDVGGELTAITKGGHVSVGQVRGDAVVRTGGGHVRVASVQGVAQLETGGGNIYLDRAGANVKANTLGGRIDFGETSGGLRARTGGGSIGVYRVAGPTEIESSGGSICLTNVQGAIRASTASGPITAWFVVAGTDGKLKGPSHLESGQGDIVVFIPREMALTIDATIESPAENRIEADPSLPLKVNYASSGGRRPVRGEAVLNGGGDVLRLRTVTGNIRLRFADSAGAPNLQVEQAVFEQAKRQLDLQRAYLEAQLQTRKKMIEAGNEQARLKETQRELSRLGIWRLKLEAMVYGSIRVSSVDQKQKALFSPRPIYPVIARSQGVQGRVRLELMIDPEGKVESHKVLEGNPLLVPAAVEAVKQWRYSPTLLDGKAVSVVTNVDFEFRMN